jgi:hypothetical protein
MGVTKRYQLPPRTGMEVFMMLPEGTLAELINDTNFMSPPPNNTHQELSAKLPAQIWNYSQKKNLGTCLSTTDVFFLITGIFLNPTFFL